MKTIRIGSACLTVKDYHCAGADGVYIPKTEDGLWLYINLTNRCNARCPFCVNPAVNRDSGVISPEALGRTLERIRPWIRGVSITGGEPMLYPELVDETAEAVIRVLGTGIHLEMVTNGTNLHRIPALRYLDNFTSIHISRHLADDGENRRLMGFQAPSLERIRELVSQLKDPGKIVFNCVMQSSGVAALPDAAAFLEAAAWASVGNTSFVGMFPANPYCREQYVSPAALDLTGDPRFTVWNHFRDYVFFSCSSGDYRSENGYVRFYYRCPGSEKAEYVRQLVYDHDDRLLDGFGGREIRFKEENCECGNC